ELTLVWVFDSYLASSLLALIIAVFIFYQIKSSSSEKSVSLLSDDLNKSSIKMWWISILAICMVQLSPLLITVLSTPKETTYFSVSLQVSLLVVFALSALNVVIAPYLSSMHSKNSTRELWVT